MAATSEVDICNLALSRLRSKQIASISPPNTEEEVVCEKHYDDSRRALLREHTWNFALKRASLAALSETPVFGFTVQYQLPDDFLRVVDFGNIRTGVILHGRTFIQDEEPLYDIEGDKILTDTSAPLEFRYVRDETDVAKFDSMFVKVFALQLALDMAYELTANNALQSNIRGELIDELAKARSVDGQERPPRLIKRSRWIRERMRTA